MDTVMIKDKDLENKILYAIGQSPDGSVELTVFQEGSSSTIELSQPLIKNMISHLNDAVLPDASIHVPMPPKFEAYLRSVVNTDDEFTSLCSKIRHAFCDVQDKKRVALISGPPCSGKTLFSNIFNKIICSDIPGINKDIALVDIITVLPVSSIANDNVVNIHFTKQIRENDIDPYLLQKIMEEIPAIICWIKGRNDIESLVDPDVQKGTTVFMDTDVFTKVINGIQRIESGFYGSIYALANSGNTQTEVFKKLCKGRDDIEDLKKDLKPSVFL